ncbi:hypothetical protein B0H14DRAFT_3457274 [Mycena olivaceomarginata]|nr:hypothetical protein B0H14DRAFT_3457274 [Mycena olivaceomarginata]
MRQSLACDIVRGLAHLHSLGIRAEIAPDKIWISQTNGCYRAIIAERGCRDAPPDDNQTPRKAPWYWYNGSNGWAYDIFALSGVLYTLFAQKIPRTVTADRPPRPDDIDDKWWGIVQMCWKDDPPTATQVMRFCKCEQASVSQGSDTDVTGYLQNSMGAAESAVLSTYMLKLAAFRSRLESENISENLLYGLAFGSIIPASGSTACDHRQRRQHLEKDQVDRWRVPLHHTPLEFDPWLLI